MARYKVLQPAVWTEDRVFESGFSTEYTDAVDTKTGRPYDNGAYRVVKDGKPALSGKGGTVPFYGESAWSDAARLAGDLALKERFGR